MGTRTWRVGDVAVELPATATLRGAAADGALEALAEAIARRRLPPPAPGALDAFGGPAPIRAYAQELGVDGVRVLLDAAGARRAVRAQGVAEERLLSAHPWDLPAGTEREVWWRPATDRGWARLVAEFGAWAQALRPDGVLVALWHKDEGAKRAERAAAERFESVEVVNRAGGWRVATLRGPRPGPAVDPWVAWEGPDGPMRTLVGTFAADRLDAGTAALLAALDGYGVDLEGARVLDLGCGSGVLARRALRLGAAEVVAVDDDLAAVRSTRAVLERAPDAAAPARASAHWSDLTLDLERPAGFDVVLTNPPFHVGRAVVGALSSGFVAAAAAALRPGGRLWLVANAALPFDRLLADWDDVADATPAGVLAYRVFSARATS